MSEHIIHVTDGSFKDEVLDATVPTLVDFWADWCGPCKMIAPILEEAAKDYAGKLRVVKINIDDNPKTPREYGIRGIPTLLLFKRRCSRSAKKLARSPNPNSRPSLTTISDLATLRAVAKP